MSGLRACAAVALLAAATPTQCGLAWSPGSGAAGVDGVVSAAMVWDPDGAGPASGGLVVAGQFRIAGAAVARNVAFWNAATATWHALGAGLGGGADEVRALAVLSGGDLVAAGEFTNSGSAVVDNVARWNGSSWQSLGSGVAGPCAALHVTAAGELVVGGRFTTAGGTAAANVARWNGVAWSPLGPGLTHALSPNVAAVAAFTTLPSGELVAGGSFDRAGTTVVPRVARWDGTSWSALGAGLGTHPLDTVRALAVTAGGQLAAGGTFGGGFATWNGSQWSTPLQVGGIHALVALPNGRLAIAWGFTTVGGVFEWSPTTLTELGSGGEIRTLAVLPDHDLVAGGSFGTYGYYAAAAGGSFAAARSRSIARYHAGTWHSLAPGTDAPVSTAVALPDGSMVVGGAFNQIGGVAARWIARWDGSTWSALGTGLAYGGSAFGAGVHAVTVAQGAVIAGGSFLQAGGSPVNNVARWDGVAWSPLGTGLSGAVLALATMPDGDVVAGGSIWAAGSVAMHGLARWNGTTWSAMGAAYGATVTALAVLPNGELVAAGDQILGSHTGRGVVRWDGSAWSTLGIASAYGTIDALAVAPNGDLVAAGSFTSLGGVAANNIACWNGTVWSALGAGVGPAVFALAALPNGDVLAGGQLSLAGGTAVSGIARWNGSTWTPIGDGVQGLWTTAVHTLARRPDASLLVGGFFSIAGGQASHGHAWVEPTCPAVAAASGLGCAGSGGANSLAALSLPWLGAVYHTRAEGLPVGSAAVEVGGFSAQAVPLLALSPAGGPGCILQVSPDLVVIHATSTGTLDLQVPLPVLPGLIGLTFHQQVLPLEFDAQGALSLITATNPLTATIGAL